MKQRVYILHENYHVDRTFVFEDYETLVQHITEDLRNAEVGSDWCYSIDVREMTQEEIDAIPEV